MMATLSGVICFLWTLVKEVSGYLWDGLLYVLLSIILFLLRWPLSFLGWNYRNYERKKQEVSERVKVGEYLTNPALG